MDGRPVERRAAVRPSRPRRRATWFIAVGFLAGLAAACTSSGATPEVIYTTAPGSAAASEAGTSPEATFSGSAETPAFTATTATEAPPAATPAPATPAPATPTPAPGATATPTPTPTPTPVPAWTIVPGNWAYTGSMTRARVNHTATLLNSGKVLIAGGTSVTAAAELYDPNTGTFTPTGSLKVNRTGHTATLLANGMVLIAGGENFSATALASAELYNPTTGQFALTGSMLAARMAFTATLLPNGTVLMAGGKNGATIVKAAETYSPTSGHFSSTAGMSIPRRWHMATALADGRVLVAGGDTTGAVTATAEIYSQTSGSWTATGSMKQARGGAAISLLADGKVIVSAGYTICTPGPCPDTPLSSGERYDPAAGTWTRTGDLLAARGAATQTLASVRLNDGRVLVTGGGTHAGDALNEVDFYDPGRMGYSTASLMKAHRSGHTVTLLPSGKVLVTGGLNASMAGQASAELFTP
jgi:hypothetical protein